MKDQQKKETPGFFKSAALWTVFCFITGASVTAGHLTTKKVVEEAEKWRRQREKNKK